MEQIDKFFERINGNYFGVMALVISIISIIVARTLYITVDPTYSMTSNFISDLGVGPNGSDLVFKIGMILTGIFQMPYYLYITLYLQKKDKNKNLLWIGLIMGFISALGLILVGVFPLDPTNSFVYNMHIIAAGLFFGGASITLFIYGFSEILNPEIPKLIAIISFISVILFGTFITVLIIQTYTSIPYQVFTYVVEWIGGFGYIMWTIVHIIYTTKNN